MEKTFDPPSPSQGRYIFPVRGCMFFGVPHKGAEIATKASKFLSLLGHVFNVNRNNVQDLEPKSQRFANISSEFRSVQSEHNIPVYSFYETVKYNQAIGLVSQTLISHNDEWQCPRLFATVNLTWRLAGKFFGFHEEATSRICTLLISISPELDHHALLLQ